MSGSLGSGGHAPHATPFGRGRSGRQFGHMRRSTGIGMSRSVFAAWRTAPVRPTRVRRRRILTHRAAQVTIKFAHQWFTQASFRGLATHKG